MCAWPLQIFGVTYGMEGGSCAQTTGSFLALHCFPGSCLVVFRLFFFFPPPAPPPMAAANAEPQCCWLLTSRGWWEKNLGHLHGQRGLGVQHGQRQNGVSGLSLTLLLTDE